MIIYFYLFIPLLFLTTDSSSIRSRNHKNDLVPFLSSRLDTLKKDPNSIKVISKEPFIIQLHVPDSKELEGRTAKEKDKKRKRPLKKRISKLKPLRKKHRKRRDLLTSKTKSRDEKLIRIEIPRPVNETERNIKNHTKNSVNRMEILKALSSYSKRNKPEGIRNYREDEKTQSGKLKKTTSNRNLHKHQLLLPERNKMIYPNTPKLERHPQKYTYKDLMADRERLEKKIKYIKNMLSVNDTTTDDAVRVRRRSDSDRTANKIAKMFLTLSAVNGLHDRKKSKCKDDDYDDDDRVQDVWERERRNNPFRKSTSSNEERYKVKKWIEFMKNKRSSGKTCPCMGNNYGEDSDAFPLEHKLPKGYFLMEKARSSEESSELYRDPLYYYRDKPNRNDDIKKKPTKAQEQESKIKGLNKNGKKKIELPFEDLELYRSRARQILQNAEEILDRIKEEEEKRLATPNILMSQLKELTSRIHGDPRNNENELIRKIQKNLGWGPLTKPQESPDGTFLDNVKSFILDPYEKAKALTDESTKKLSSYLLRNLGRLQDSSEEQEGRNANDQNNDEGLKVYFGEVPQREEKPSSASLAREEDSLFKSKEDLQNWEDTVSAILETGDDGINKESNLDDNREPFSVKMDDVIRETQKKLNDFKDPSSKETDEVKTLQSEKEIVAETKPESISEEEKVAETKPESILEENVAESKPESILGEENVAKSKPESILEEENVAESKPDSILEEEKVRGMLKEKETEENNKKSDFRSGQKHDDEKGIKNAEDPAVALEKSSKGSDIVKNKKFRGKEGTFQGEKGGDSVTATGDMQEEKEFEKEIEEIMKAVEKEKNADEDLKTDEEVVRNPKAEENEQDIANEENVAQVLRQEKDEDENEKEDIIAASPNIEKATSEEKKSADSTTAEQTVEKESYVSSPPVLQSYDALPDDNQFDAATETEKDSKETVKATLEEGKFETDEEPVLEKQRKFDDAEGLEEIEVEGKKSDNSKEGSDLESPLVSEELLKETEKQDPMMEVNEGGVKTLPEYADLVQEANQGSKEFLDSTESKLEAKHQSSERLDDSKRDEEETLKSEYEENQNVEDTRTGDENGEVLRSMLDNEGIGEILEGIIQNNSGEPSENQPMSEDVNNPLKATLEKQETSNEPLDGQDRYKENDDDALLKETNPEDEKNENMEEDNNGETSQKETTDNKSEEILRKEKNDETSLLEEKYTEDKENERRKSAEDEKDETLLKESKLDEEVAQNVEDDETPLRAVMSNQEDQNAEDEDEVKGYDSSEMNEKEFDDEGSNESQLKGSLNKNEDLEKVDDTTLQAKNPTQLEGEKEEEEETQNLNKSQERTFNLAKLSDDVGNQRENTERGDEKENSETLGVAREEQEKENSYEMGEKAISKENQKSEKDEGESILRAENTEYKETSQETSEFFSSEERETSKENDSYEILREANSNEENGDYSEEISSYETLEATSDNQKEESQQVNEDEIPEGEVDLKKASDDENVRAVLENETQENLEEPDEENVKRVKDSEETLKGAKDDEEYLKAVKDGKESLKGVRDDEETLKSEDNQETLKEVKDDEEALKRVKDDEYLKAVKDSRESLKGVKDDEENLKAIKDGETLKRIKDNEEALKRVKDDEEYLKAVKDSKESLIGVRDDEETLKTEEDNEETLKEAKDGEKVLKGVKDSEEYLKAVKDGKESLKGVKDDEETLKAVKDGNENLRRIKEGEETLKAVKDNKESEESQEETNLEAKYEYNDEEDEPNLARERKIEGPEQKQDMMSEDDVVRAVLDNQEQQVYGSMENSNEGKNNKMEEDKNDDKILQKIKNSNEDMNQNLKEGSTEIEQNVRAENPDNEKQEKEIDDEETDLRRADLEDEFDNKIDEETPLKSAHSFEESDNVESVKNENEREEILREDNLNNQIDEETEDKPVLKSVHIDPESSGLAKDGYETPENQKQEDESSLKATNPEYEIFDPSKYSFLDQHQGPFREYASSDHLQNSFPQQTKTKQTPEIKKLKVPDSIGKIMKDLEGKEKYDITSLQNLNPDKIDHMLDKIGQAEQQNLLESEEVDCRKECACAEEMNLRSRNIGRYEIVKDFLHWVKDLQLNRVLSDD